MLSFVISFNIICNSSLPQSRKMFTYICLCFFCNGRARRSRRDLRSACWTRPGWQDPEIGSGAQRGQSVASPSLPIRAFSLRSHFRWLQIPRETRSWEVRNPCTRSQWILLQQFCFNRIYQLYITRVHICPVFYSLMYIMC